MKKYYCPKCSSVLVFEEPKTYRCSKCDYSIHSKTAVETGYKCPKCGDYLLYKKGRNKPYWGCHNPDCNYKKTQ